MKEWGCTPINKSLIPQWGDQKRFLKRANTSEGSAPCGMRLKSLFCLYLWSQIFQLGLKENPRRHLELWNNYRCRSTSSLFILKLMPYLLCLYMCFFWVAISQVAVTARGSGGQLVNNCDLETDSVSTNMWSPMNLCTDSHDPQRTNPANFTRLTANLKIFPRSTASQPDSTSMFFLFFKMFDQAQSMK